MQHILLTDSKRFDCKLCETQLLCKFDDQCLVVYKLRGKSICRKCRKLFSILDGLWRDMFRCIDEALTAATETSGKVTSDTDEGDIELCELTTGNTCEGDTITEDTDGVITYDVMIGDIHTGDEIIEEDGTGNIITANTLAGQTIATITEAAPIREKLTRDTHTGDTSITENTHSDDRVSGERDMDDAVAAAEGRTKKKHECDVCGKCFTFSQNLRRHILGHTGTNPFGCEKCGKRFYRKDRLNEHVCTHPGVKKFQCRYCGNWFAFKSNYLRHIAIKSCKEDFESGICGQFFLSPIIAKQLIVAHKNKKTLALPASEPGPIDTHGEKTVTEDKDACRTAAGDTDTGASGTGEITTGVTHPGEMHTDETLGDKLPGDRRVEDTSNMDEKDHLASPTLTHTPKSMFQCEDCGMWFTMKKQLTMHVHTQNCKKKLESGKDGTGLVAQAASSDCMVVHVGEDKVVRVRQSDDTVTADTHRDDTVAEDTPSTSETSAAIRGKTNKLKCNECGKLFDSKSSLESHTVKHNKANKFKCDRCKENFSKQSDLTQHLISHCGETFQCLYCGKKFAKRKILIMHARTEECQEKFESGQLGPLFVSQSTLEQLMAVHERVNSLTLEEDFDSMPGMGKKKAKAHTGEKKVKAHTDEKVKSQTVEEKLKTYTQKKRIMRGSDEHCVKTPSGETKFACGSCGKLFSTKKLRGGHIKRMHRLPRGKREKNIQCDCCGKLFSSAYGLKTHKKTVQGEMKFECGTCGKRFVHRGHLNYHIRTHTGERSFVCEYCGKSYPQSSSLKMHIKKHEGLRDYLCTHCDKGFYAKRDLEVHIERMHGAQPGRQRRQIT